VLALLVAVAVKVRRVLLVAAQQVAQVAQVKMYQLSSAAHRCLRQAAAVVVARQAAQAAVQSVVLAAQVVLVQRLVRTPHQVAVVLGLL